MIVVERRTLSGLLLSIAVAWSAFVDPRPAAAVEVGQSAPSFTMPSTTGTDISLSDFRGKKWVLLEFYGHDFVPT